MISVHNMIINPEKPEEMVEMLNIIEHSEKILTIFKVPSELQHMIRVFIVTRLKDL